MVTSCGWLSTGAKPLFGTEGNGSCAAGWKPLPLEPESLPELPVELVEPAPLEAPLLEERLDAPKLLPLVAPAVLAAPVELLAFEIGFAPCAPPVVPLTPSLADSTGPSWSAQPALAIRASAKARRPTPIFLTPAQCLFEQLPFQPNRRARATSFRRLRSKASCVG